MPRTETDRPGPNLPPGVQHFPATSKSAVMTEGVPPPPPPEASGMKSLAESLGLTEDLAPPLAPPRRAYHVGVLPTCPLEVVHLGAVAFPRYTERVSGSGTNTVRSQVLGAIAFLTDAQYEKVIAAVKVRFVRRIGKRAEILVHGAPHGAPAQREYGDEPLARHIYMERRTDLDGAAGVAPSLPKSLAEAATAGA